MRDRMKSILPPDDVIPASSVFPDLDARRIARDLRLEEQGLVRGAAGHPRTTAQELDPIEVSAVDAIATLRRKGLESYETNRRLYNERLVRAQRGVQEAETAVAAVKNDFDALAELHRSQIEEAREKLQEASAWRKRYREIHGLDRPAVAFMGWSKVFSVLALLILAGSAAGGLLFWSAGAFGSGGGLFAALLISAASAGISATLGRLARYVGHRSPPLKLGGILVFPFWICSAAALGFGGAHLLEALGGGADWRAATGSAAAELLTGNLSPASVEGGLLLAACLSISAAAFLLGWRMDDPYPGYGEIDRARSEARIAYEERLQGALEDLQRRRDRAVEDLQDAAERLRCGVAEAEDALFGQGALNGQLKAFLEQCDLKTAHLLLLYREANRRGRSSIAPPSFDQSHRFAEFQLSPVTAEPAASKQGTQRMIALIDDAVREIHEGFDHAKARFYGEEGPPRAPSGAREDKIPPPPQARPKAEAEPDASPPPPPDRLPDPPESLLLRLRRLRSQAARAASLQP